MALFGCRRLKRVETTLLAFSREALEILRSLEKKVKDMSTGMEDLQREVEEATTVAQSAVTLINGLAQQIRDLKDDPVKLEELATKLDASSQALAAVVAANTVAEEEEEPEEPSEEVDPDAPSGDDTPSS